ncbi:MAG: SAM-dependent chlorinase/fluorinase [Acidimicrobiia bacterium]
MPPGTVSFLTDYGTRDESVGVCKAVMLGLAPALTIVDITHEIPPHDVKTGALTLARAAPYLPSGIVVAVVDPGVGTGRRAIAVEVEHGFLLGPDNGLLAPAAALLGGARRVVHLTNESYHLPSPGPTFAGRDVFAPAAGHLASGVAMAELGEPVDPVSLVPGLVPLPEHRDDGAVVGEVLWIDRFGNCQLNVDAEELETRGLGPGGPVDVEIRGERRAVRWVDTYADARASEVVLVVDSYGLVALAVDRGSAAETCRLAPFTSVVLRPGGPA